MSLQKFGYSSEQLKLKEYQALKEKVESLEKINQITHSKLKEDFENTLEDELENQEKAKRKNKSRIFRHTRNSRPSFEFKINKRYLFPVFRPFKHYKQIRPTY